ncbi:NADP-dependent oxidoreductase [Agromyces intestinalis]|uniref:NADP-dependent oxidoreductase n=1 Tax=Agromyces intestinalis TaxID=2592652 RepID=A0A5C1YJF4_9MICO|nr:NADP-dependent oxidoreductase [Agromyces intestinalis]QEO15390.1 NADP-dependent oxidoreductase [Agromyces intestinalis]
MSHAVRYSSFGAPEVLEVVEVDTPEPGAGEVVVEVFASGINPAESVARRGEAPEGRLPDLPARSGREFAGVVVAVGDGVDRVARGDEVIGIVDAGAHATHVVAPAEVLVHRPVEVPWEVAAALPVAGTTAWQAVESLGLGDRDTVVVTAAAGGVGCLAAQFARLHGATVVGVTADSRFDFLRQFGVIPVGYGHGLAERVRAAAAGPVTAFLDFLGGEADAAAELGVAPSRVLTTLDHAAVEGGRASIIEPGDRVALARVARAIADHRVRLPIADIVPLDHVADAYRTLDRRDAPGKIVLGMRVVDYPAQRSHEPDLKEQDVTLGVPTPHEHMEVTEQVPAAIADGSVRRRHREERASNDSE